MAYLTRSLPVFCALLVVAGAQTTEPLIGTWKLASQTINDKKIDTEDLILRVYPAGDALEFAYSIAINGVHMVSTKFTGVHLDGTPGDVQDVRGNKVGHVKLLKSGPAQYRAEIEGVNHPKAAGKMTISADGKTLTSESDSTVPGRGPVHAVQVFSRS